MRTYIVNLDRRPDRRRRMEAILPRGLDVEFTTEWGGPTNGRLINFEAIKDFKLFPWKIESDNPWWNRPLKWGEVGCAVNHLLCWRKAVEEGLEKFMVLEDDVVIATEFLNKLEVGIDSISRHDPEWDLVYLGRNPVGKDELFLPGIVRPGYSKCTFGYILSRFGAQKLLDAGLDKALVPVDEFISAMYCNHPRTDLRERFPKRLRAYAFEPPLVTQLPKDTVGSDTEDTEFVN